MTLANLPPLVTVFGGSGFVGRNVVRALAVRGYRIRVAVRRPDLAGFLQPLGNVGQISFAQANIRYPDSIAKAVEGASYVINCVGILNQTGQNTFEAIHDIGVRTITLAAKSVGAKLTHLSSIGADVNALSDYARTKGKGEAIVREISPDAIIIRPSVVFGADDDFFNKLASMAQCLPFIPAIGGGNTKLQPVSVTDVAEVVARSIDGSLKSGAVYEIGGPEILTFRQCAQLVLATTYRTNPIVNVPFSIASMIGKIAGLIPLVKPVLTTDQVKQLKTDNVVSETAIAAGLTLDGLGIQATNVASVLPTYMVSYRVSGQFNNAGKAA